MNNIRKYINEHIEAVYYLSENCTDDIIAIANTIIESISNGGKLLICGNGGSAADAQHIATELVCRFTRNRRALAALALTCDTSALTAIPNDFGYDIVFARQVEALGKPGDVLLAISTSGKSVSIVKAAEQARQMGLKVIAFTGIPESPLQKIADLCFCANSTVTAITQEMHQIAYHIICDKVENKFAQ